MPMRTLLRSAAETPPTSGTPRLSKANAAMLLQLYAFPAKVSCGVATNLAAQLSSGLAFRCSRTILLAIQFLSALFDSKEHGRELHRVIGNADGADPIHMMTDTVDALK